MRQPLTVSLLQKKAAQNPAIETLIRRTGRKFQKDEPVLAGIFLAMFAAMEMFICDHCRNPFQGKIYRVRSEEAGVVLLNMVVCYACYLEAKKLNLDTEEIVSRPSDPKNHSRLAHWFRKSVGSSPQT